MSRAALAALGLTLLAPASLALAAPDPAVLSYTLPDKLDWKGDPKFGPQQITLWGDPAKPGPYAILIKWPPNVMSRPHTHPFDRHITVISGTWWVGTGKIYDPASTTPMPAGTVVTHLANQPHYDGAKDEPCIIEIVGEGPAPVVPVR
jgi:hypothetical protein